MYTMKDSYRSTSEGIMKAIVHWLMLGLSAVRCWLRRVCSNASSIDREPAGNRGPLKRERRNQRCRAAGTKATQACRTRCGTHGSRCGIPGLRGAPTQTVGVGVARVDRRGSNQHELPDQQALSADTGPTREVLRRSQGGLHLRQSDAQRFGRGYSCSDPVARSARSLCSRFGGEAVGASRHDDNGGVFCARPGSHPGVSRSGR